MKVKTVDERRNPKRNMRLQKKLHVGYFEKRCFHFEVLNCPDHIENEKMFYDVVDRIFDMNDTRDDGVFVGCMFGLKASGDFPAGRLDDADWEFFLDEVIEAFEYNLQQINPDIKVQLMKDDEDHMKDAWYDF